MGQALGLVGPTTCSVSDLCGTDARNGCAMEVVVLLFFRHQFHSAL